MYTSSHPGISNEDFLEVRVKVVDLVPNKPVFTELSCSDGKWFYFKKGGVYRMT